MNWLYFACIQCIFCIQCMHVYSRPAAHTDFSLLFSKTQADATAPARTYISKSYDVIITCNLQFTCNIFFTNLQVTKGNLWHTYFESWEKNRVKNMCFYPNIFLWKIVIIWPNLDLTSVKSQVRWCHRVKWSLLSKSSWKMPQKTCVARHACDSSFSDLLWPDLDHLGIWPMYSCSTLLRHIPALWASLSSLQPNQATREFKMWKVAFWHLALPWPDTKP